LGRSVNMKTIYIYDENLEKWNNIENKSELINKILKGEII